MTKFTRSALFVLSLTALTASSAHAGGLVGLDLGVHGGGASAPDSDSTSFIGGVQARLHLLTFLAVEARGSGFKNTYEGPLMQSVDLTTYPIQGSIMLYPLPLPKLSLYVLGGGGYHSYKLEYAPSTGGSPVSVSDGLWAVHAGAGLDIKASKNFIINLDARYVFLDVSSLSDITGKDANYWCATVGLNWRLF